MQLHNMISYYIVTKAGRWYISVVAHLNRYYASGVREAMQPIYITFSTTQSSSSATTPAT